MCPPSYLAYLLRPKPVEPSISEEGPLPDAPPSSHSAAGGGTVRGHTSRLSEALNKGADFTSMFVSGMSGGGRAGGSDKSSKFPEKTIKVLDDKLRNIFMGKDTKWVVGLQGGATER